jgi:hypothetical protein
MARSILESSWHKFHWAEQHMQALDTHFARVLDPKTEPVAVDSYVEVGGDGARVRLVVAKVPAIQTDAALIVGDAVQNFRAALDHLAWDLVRIGSQPHPKDPRQIYFPMAKNAESFGQMLSQRLPGVPKSHWTIARRYQPYRSGERAKAMRWLRHLSDVDKHRVMTPLAMNASHVNMTITSDWPLVDCAYTLVRPKPLKVGTELAQAVLRRVGAGNPQVNVQGNLPIYPALSYRRPLGEVLSAIARTVRDVLTEFDNVL